MTSAAHVRIRYGYTMADLDRLAKYAARNHRTGQAGADIDELYEAAGGAAVETLCAVDRPPGMEEMRLAALRGADGARREISRHHGVDQHDQWKGTYVASGFLKYWIDPSPGSPVEERVLDPLAIRQVLAALKPRHEKILALLAAHDGNVSAAAASGRASYPSLVVEARRAALALWHDKETPRRVRVETWTSRAVRYPCGTDQAYRRHMRRRERPCDECRTAHSVVMSAYYERRKAAVR